ncbi:hypothetical protein TESG_01315 [Trichophyton tonsurans CBS 112818]|uniref:SSCRP protein n=1 Tax=Trichophyton tonsurans (strain CBS 112818) TaxID=647933 RepID=F2RR32_TRIT1|nr:hypothetical protein TESG_01315 [Trichophyton tonsurans CBS 112818]
MRFFLASLLLAAAALVSADSGDKIGALHTDRNCEPEGIDLFDNECTPNPGGSINLAVAGAVCYGFPDEACNEPTTTPDGVQFNNGCDSLDRLEGGGDFLKCFGGN